MTSLLLWIALGIVLQVGLFHAAGTATAGAEDAIEITWRIAIRQWLQVQPNLQHVRHPGGALTARHATLIGARVDITF